MPDIERSKVRAMLEDAPEDQREPILLRLKERGFTVVEDGALKDSVSENPPESVAQRIGNAASSVWNAPAPGLAVAKGAMRVGGGALENAGGTISEELGKRGVPDVLSATAGAALAIPGAIYSKASEFVPSTVGDLVVQEVGGQAVKLAGRGASAMLPAIESRAPNAVRAVKAAMSANILPTPTQATQSEALASAEEIASGLPWFGRRIKAMRQAQENAYQAFKTSTLESAGPKVAPEEFGAVARSKIAGEVESVAAEREIALAKEHAKILKVGGNPTTAEAAARELDAIRVANVEQSRLTAGKFYDELKIPPELDKVQHSATRATVDKWAQEYANLPQAKKEAFSPLARGLMEDIKAGPGMNTIENSPNPLQPLSPDISEVLGGRKSYTFREIQTLRSTINSGLHQARLKGADREAAMLGDLKKSLDSDIAAFGKSLPGDIAGEFEAATAYYKNIYKGIYRNETVDTLGKVAKKNPQAVYDMLIGRGNVVDIKAVKAAVGEQGFAPMRSLAVRNMVTSAEGRPLSGAEITKRLSEYTPEALKEILTPRQMSEIVKYKTTRELPKFIESELENKLRGVIFESGGSFRMPQEVTGRIINGDAATLKAVKNIVGPKGSDQLRRLIMEDIMGEAYNPTLLPGQAENRTAFKMGKALREYSDEFRKEAFPEPMLKQIDQIDDIKALLESQQRLKSNASGTAAKTVSQLAPYAAGGLLWTHPGGTLATLISAEVVTRLYTSEAGRRLLIEGLNPKSVANAQLYGRISAFLAKAAREKANEDRSDFGTKNK